MFYGKGLITHSLEELTVLEPKHNQVLTTHASAALFCECRPDDMTRDVLSVSTDITRRRRSTCHLLRAAPADHAHAGDDLDRACPFTVLSLLEKNCDLVINGEEL